MTSPAHDATDPVLSRLSDVLKAVPQRGLPPVETWHPKHCGVIDIRIAADGTWYHEGSPIRRPALVNLFSTILRKEPDGSTVLVTPVERMTIRVDDVPFVVAEMAVEGEGSHRRIAFRTNVDDVVSLDSDHRLRGGTDAAGGLKPYLHVRGDLWARLTRALTYDLVELCEERVIDGQAWFGLECGGMFHKLALSDPAETS